VAVAVGVAGVLPPLILLALGRAQGSAGVESLGWFLVGMPSALFASRCAFRLESIGRERAAAGAAGATGWLFLGAIAVSYVARLVPGALGMAIACGAFAAAVYVLQREFNRNVGGAAPVAASGTVVATPIDAPGDPGAGAVARAIPAGLSAGGPEVAPEGKSQAPKRGAGSPGWGLGLGIFALVAWLVPILGSVAGVVGLVLSARAIRGRRHGMAIAGTIVCGIGVTLSVIHGLLTALVTLSGDPASGDAPPAPRLGGAPAGLERRELRLTAAMVSGSWVERDLLIDDPFEWTGSAAVLGEHEGELILVTNAHCLGLRELAEADDDRRPEVARYDLVVRFPSGRELPVRRFKWHADGVDLALVTVGASGLVRGTDYVCVAFDDGATPEQGAEVVAVGAPLGIFEGSMTFGRISAFREDRLGETGFRWIQTDAAINHGNSGGPLFLCRQDRYVCIGFNTRKWVEPGVEGLGFAIPASILRSNRFSDWCPASASDVQRLLGN
jgi:S1-C subfamily serine protease